ncbi:hypothetical protein DPM33_32990 [Mesorhizobium hawassense]|uniref:Uncharacterized protein n=1 Tax=Mesorhizobium hawassense TaxID=1209954 RepID=A0A330H3L9_9HYPH|nr:hypothetical protein [Mesorhizobium hawassense]RAZ83201.1 hypothetical protein DPM33_32990 [Mesorhizobium hawassense]
MTTPILEVKTSTETQLLYGKGARFAASSDGVVNIRPIDNNAVTVRAIFTATKSRPLNGGDALSVTLSAGDVIELV